MAYWAATQLQKNRERVAEYFLQQFGFEVYLPRVRARGNRQAEEALGNPILDVRAGY